MQTELSAEFVAILAILSVPAAYLAGLLFRDDKAFRILFVSVLSSLWLCPLVSKQFWLKGGSGLMATAFVIASVAIFVSGYLGCKYGRNRQMVKYTGPTRIY